MQAFDCFNGDADGICALTQLRLAEPRDGKLITGVKRDIELLARVHAQAGDQVTVLDVSLDKNRVALSQLLETGAQVFYCDHHYAGEVPKHNGLTTLINTTPDVCTSLLINQHLGGRYLGWAVVGTFGDNLDKSARGLAKGLDISADELEKYAQLGIYLNYNGYGSALEDLYFDPAELYQRLVRFESPHEFMHEDAATVATLEQGFKTDMANATAVDAEFDSGHAAVFHLPNAAWARRVSGVFGNQLANQHPDRAHAVLTVRADDDFLVSVRAPLNRKAGADDVCRQFDTGGGRAAAAGINQLPQAELSRFVSVFSEYYAA